MTSVGPSHYFSHGKLWGGSFLLSPAALESTRHIPRPLYSHAVASHDGLLTLGTFTLPWEQIESTAVVSSSPEAVRLTEGPPTPLPEPLEESTAPAPPPPRIVRYHSYVNPFNASDSYHALDTSLASFRAYLVYCGAVPAHVAHHPDITTIASQQLVMIYPANESQHVGSAATTKEAASVSNHQIPVGATVLHVGGAEERAWRERWRRQWFQRRLITDRTEWLTRYPSDSSTGGSTGAATLGTAAEASPHKRGGFFDLLAVHGDRFKMFLQDEWDEAQKINTTHTTDNSHAWSGASWNGESPHEQHKSSQGGVPKVVSLLAWMKESYGAERTEVLRVERMFPVSSIAFGGAYQPMLDPPLKRIKTFLEWFRTKFPYYHDRCQSCGASLREERANRRSESAALQGEASTSNSTLSDSILPPIRCENNENHSSSQNACDNDNDENDEDHDDDEEEERTFLGYVYPEAHELAGKASRTELYQCHVCSEFFRFPRYNAVSYVVSDHRGRCGEYSMLLFRIMRALGHETRWVVDWADHVWVEIAVPTAFLPPSTRSSHGASDAATSSVSSTGFRWIHLDPCEAAVDENLLYESWGKKPTYIVSFYAPQSSSPTASFPLTRHSDHRWGASTTQIIASVSATSVPSIVSTTPSVVDVTGDYTSHSWEEVVSRRSESDAEVASAIEHVREQLRTNILKSSLLVTA
jgi:Transglutaminase-like superfamily